VEPIVRIIPSVLTCPAICGKELSMSDDRIPGPLERQIDAAVDGMEWLSEADKASVELARVYARRIDEATLNEQGQEVTKALYLGPHLLNTLKALGGTPDERMKMLATKGEEKEVDSIDDLRKKRRP